MEELKKDFIDNIIVLNKSAWLLNEEPLEKNQVRWVDVDEKNFLHYTLSSWSWTILYSVSNSPLWIPTAITHTNTTYEITKQIVNKSIEWWVLISHEIASWSWALAYSKIIINNALVASRSTTDTSYFTYNETVTLAKWDIIEQRVKATTWDTAKTRKLEIKATVTPAVVVDVAKILNE